MVASTAPGESYSLGVAFVMIFNLIVGVGALALPYGFQQAGLILGLIFLAILGFLAFVTVTWVTEVQASANAYLATRAEETKTINSVFTKNQDTQPLLPSDNEIETASLPTIKFVTPRSIFDIKQRVEMGLLSELFLGPIGQKAFYAIIIIYLYGDLAIYAATIPTSLAQVTKDIHIGSLSISQHNVYYLYLALFSVLIIPWTFFNFQKTKYLQLATIFTRNLSLFCMIILALIFIGEGNGAPIRDVPFVEPGGLPALFGVSIYAFMCHHSLPSLITPVKNKSRLRLLLAGDFITIYIVYALLCLTALLAFGDQTNSTCESHPAPACKIQPLYTLNFSSYNIRPIATFLTLFPVFTLSSNFPLIAITLRNNLLLLFPVGDRNPRMKQIMFSLVACVPPICVAFVERNVSVLVSFTGSYAGLGIMFVVPAFLLLYSRRKLEGLGINIHDNPHKSPFGHRAYVICILIASALSLGVITFNIVYKAVHHELV